MTNADLLKQKLALLASSGVLSDSAVNTIDATIKLLNAQEAVVRCRDCKFWYKDECSHLCAITGDLRPKNWFCADGEHA